MDTHLNCVVNVSRSSLLEQEAGTLWLREQPVTGFLYSFKNTKRKQLPLPDELFKGLVQRLCSYCCDYVTYI